MTTTRMVAAISDSSPRLWKWLLAIYFTLLVCDGALRKWVWPELGVLVFGVKDAVLVLCLLIALLSRTSRTERMSPRMPAYATALAILWCALTLVRALPDPASLSTVIGLRYYLIGLPLVYLVYRLLRSSPNVQRLVGYVVFAAIATGLLGIVQFYSPADSAINRYAWSTMENIAGFGGELDLTETRARITSTFSYISTYAAFLQFAVCLLLATAVTVTSTRQQAGTLTALGIVAVNALMTGSRAIAVMLVLALLLFVWLFPSRFGGMVKNPARALATTILLVAMGLAVIDPLSAFVERTSAVLQAYGEAEAENRIVGALLGPYYTIFDAGTFGLGVGASFLGFGELQGYGGANWRFDEIIHDRVGIELGAPIYIFVLIVKIFFVLLGARVATRASTREVRAWATAMVAYQLMFVWTIPFYNPVASPLYFTSVAVLLFLQARERRSRWAKVRQAFANGAIRAS